MTERELIERLHDGWIILFGPAVSQLVTRPQLIPPGPAPIEVPPTLIMRMIASGTLGGVSKVGFPALGSPLRDRPGFGFKAGWKEMELPDPGPARYYLMSQ